MDKIKDFADGSARWLSLKDFEGEIWKDIAGFKGVYQVSNYGRIKALDRYITNCRGVKYFCKGKIISPWKNTGGYCRYFLYKNNTKVCIIAHRLVAELFVPNPNNLPIVNHKDENPSNNCFWNLEWCTHTYNMNYGTAPLRKKRKMLNRPDESRTIYQFTLSGELVNTYPSANEAERQTGIKATNILSVCGNKRSSSAGGFIWSQSNNKDDINDKINRKKDKAYSYAQKRVVRYTKNGVYIDEFPSISAAAKTLGIHKDTISRVCKNKGYYKTAGGYMFKFKE